MDGKIFVLVIIFGSFAFSAFMKSLSAKENANKKKAREADDDLKAQVRALEERVRVLERIATDKSSRLREEIDAL